MPTYRVTDPESGKTLNLTGDSPPTEGELEKIFSQYQPKEEQTETMLPPVVAEAAGAINRGITALPGMAVGAVDYVADTLGGAPQKAWEEVSTPLRRAIAASGKRNFMEPGLARDIVQTGGEYVPGIVGAAAGGRKIAKDLTQELLERPNVAVTGAKIRAGEAETVKRTISETGQIVADETASEAIKQGFGEGVVSAIKASSGKTRGAMRTMVARLERGMNNARWGAANRPSDVVGEAVAKRLSAIQDVNRQAGKRLNVEAKRLAGQQVKLERPISEFLDELAERGVSVGDDLKVSLRGSEFEDTGADKILNTLLRRLNTAADDALEAHRLKRFIDEQVNYAKGGDGGLSATVERMAKGLRRGIDSELDSAFPAYKEVNDVFSETKGVIDAFRDAAYSKLNLSGPNVEKAIGTLARRLLSNTPSRVNLINSLEGLDDVAMKYGVDVSDDIMSMAMFADELDKVFRPVAKTSLAGEVAKTAATEGRSGVVRDLAGRGIDMARGVNQQGALKAVKELLAP